MLKAHKLPIYFLVLLNPACLGESLYCWPALLVSVEVTSPPFPAGAAVQGHPGPSLDSSLLDLTSLPRAKGGLSLQPTRTATFDLFLTADDCRNLIMAESPESWIILPSAACNRYPLKVLKSYLIILAKTSVGPDLSADVPEKGFSTSVILKLVGMG